MAWLFRFFNQTVILQDSKCRHLNSISHALILNINRYAARSNLGHSAAPIILMVSLIAGATAATVISAPGNIASASIDQTFSGPTSVAYDPHNHMVYVANGYADNLKVIESSTNKIIKSMGVGEIPGHVFFNPATSEILVANGGTNTVAVINDTTNSVVSKIVLPTFRNQYGSFAYQAYGFAYDSKNSHVYVLAMRLGWGTGTDDTVVYALDGHTYKILSTLDLGSAAEPGGIAFDPRNGYLYIGDQNRFVPDSNIDVIDTQTNTMVKQIYNREQGEAWAYPDSVAVDSKNGKVYVANSGPANVRVIGDSSNAIQTTIHVKVSDMALDASHDRLYAASSQTLSVIDLTSNAVIKTVPLWQKSSYCSLMFNCPSMDSITLDSAHGQLYVGNAGAGVVSVASIAAGSMVASIPLDNVPDAFAFDQKSGLIYVANTDSDNIVVIDGSSNAIIDKIALPQKSVPAALLIGPSNGYLYMADIGTSSVDMISISTHNIVKSIPVGNGPIALGFDPVNKEIYVANYNSYTITAIDATTNTVKATINNTFFVDGFAFDSKNNAMYASLPGKVFVIDGKTDTIAKQISLSAYGTAGIVFNPSNGYLYTADSHSNTVTIIDGATNTVKTTVAVGLEPSQLALNPATHEVYVTNLHSNSISVIDTATNTISATISLANPSGPDALLFDNLNNHMYVADAYSGKIGVIDGATHMIIKTIYD